MKILLCIPGNNFSGTFLDCLIDTINFFNKKSWIFAISRRESSNIYHLRSMCLGANVLRGKNQKPFDDKFDYDWVLWIDSDIVWKPLDIMNLLNTEGEVVSGLYRMSNKVQFTAIDDWNEDYFREHGTFKFIEEDDLKSPKYQSPFEVIYVGMGFMAVKKGIFENIEYPWFEPKFFDFGNGICDFSSEDVGFCLKVRDKGHKIIVNPKIIVGHEKKVIL